MAIALNNPTNKLTEFCSLMRLASRLYKSNPTNPTTKKSMDITNDDVLDLFSSLNKHHVKYLLVGGMAGVFHGHIRTTQDLDLWVEASPNNRAQLISALQENNVVGASYLKDMPFIFGYTAVRFGSKGFELDLGDELSLFKQTDFDACYSRANTGMLDGVPFSVIHINDLIHEKEKPARPKDLGDAAALKEIRDSKN